MYESNLVIDKLCKLFTLILIKSEICSSICVSFLHAPGSDDGAGWLLASSLGKCLFLLLFLDRFSIANNVRGTLSAWNVVVFLIKIVIWQFLSISSCCNLHLLFFTHLHISFFLLFFLSGVHWWYELLLHCWLSLLQKVWWEIIIAIIRLIFDFCDQWRLLLHSKLQLLSLLFQSDQLCFLTFNLSLAC